MSCRRASAAASPAKEGRTASCACKSTGAQRSESKKIAAICFSQWLFWRERAMQVIDSGRFRRVRLAVVVPRGFRLSSRRGGANGREAVVSILGNTQSMICGFRSWLPIFLQENGRVNQGKSLSRASEWLPKCEENVLCEPLSLGRQPGRKKRHNGPF